MTRTTLKLVREGPYLAEVPVEVIRDEEDWSPRLSVDDARKLETVRLALRAGDLATAAKYGQVFKMTPLSP
jgi:hypothetical protein